MFASVVRVHIAIAITAAAIVVLVAVAIVAIAAVVRAAHCAGAGEALRVGDGMLPVVLVAVDARIGDGACSGEN